MNDYIGFVNFCAACKGSKEENGKLICKDESGRFYGLPVTSVRMAPCIKKKTIEELNKIKLVGLSFD